MSTYTITINDDGEHNITVSIEDEDTRRMGYWVPKHCGSLYLDKQFDFFMHWIGHAQPPIETIESSKQAEVTHARFFGENIRRAAAILNAEREEGKNVENEEELREAFKIGWADGQRYLVNGLTKGSAESFTEFFKLRKEKP